MKKRWLVVIMLLGVIAFASPAPGSAAKGGGNPLEALQTQINDLQTRITNLEAQVSALQNGQGGIALLETRVSAIENNSVLTLNGYLSRDTDNSGYNRALFTGVNVQILNGNGSTNGTPNGLGNLIVGYNEMPQESQIYTRVLIIS